MCIIAAPAVAFQYYGYHSFCRGSDRTSTPEWCLHKLPYLYGHVQKTYWNVGLFRFYHWRQVISRQGAACIQQCIPDNKTSTSHITSLCL